jgi:hypothetical protein
MVADFVPSSNAKDAVVADPDQPVISASPASAKRVIPPVPFTAIGCAVRWLAERRPDPHNGERDHDEDRDDDFAPHAATVATADLPMVAAMWQFGSLGCECSLPRTPGGCRRLQGQPTYGQGGYDGSLLVIHADGCFGLASLRIQTPVPIEPGPGGGGC